MVVVQDSDENLVLSHLEKIIKAYNPPSVKMTDVVLSVNDDSLIEKLQKFKMTNGRGLIVIKDFLSQYENNPHALREVREMALIARPGNDYPRLILVEQAFSKVPLAIAGDVEVVRPELPTTAELLDELNQFTSVQKEIVFNPDTEADDRYSIASSVSGLPRHEAARLYRRCWVDKKAMDPGWLRNEKAIRVTQRLGGALTFESSDGADVGGVEVLREWVDQRKMAFGSKKAREWGLPEPKGVLLLGVPGCGKSHVAKAIARWWDLPLLRLDAGKLFGSLVGQSESQTRLAIETAEVSAPCVLWIDELDKLFGGMSGSGDSGTSSRVFGTVLTWLNEKTKPVFVVATANNIGALPDELLRKGRFDEIFFVGLPNVYERRQIINIHLARRGIAIQEDKVNALAEASYRFSGAELEQAVIEAQFTRYYKDQGAVTYEDVLAALKGTEPLSRTSPQKIEAIESRAKGTRLASRPIDTAGTSGSIRGDGIGGELEL